MFKTLILVCALDVVDLNQCTIFEDIWGPYTTKVECRLRAKQMQKDIADFIYEPVKSYHKCEESI
jgi:hypothetical protein